MNKHTGKHSITRVKEETSRKFSDMTEDQREGWFKNNLFSPAWFSKCLSLAPGLFVTRKFTFKYLLSGFKLQILQSSVFPHYPADAFLNWWDSSHPLKPNKLALLCAKGWREHIPVDKPRWNTPGLGVPRRGLTVSRRGLFPWTPSPGLVLSTGMLPIPCLTQYYFSPKQLEMCH